MSRDLTNLFIDETFQYLTQISGSNQDILLDGVGNRITELDISASHALTADNSISSSHSVTADSSSFANISISSLHALTADTSISSSFATVAATATSALTSISSSHATVADLATTASYALNGGVTSITAGTNITIDQSEGDVTINSSGGDSFPYTGSAIISGSLTLETLNNPGFLIINPSNLNNYIQIGPEDGNAYTKNTFNMGAERNFFQSPGDILFNTDWDAGSSGSL